MPNVITYRSDISQSENGRIYNQRMLPVHPWEGLVQFALKERNKLEQVRSAHGTIRAGHTSATECPISAAHISAFHLSRWHLLACQDESKLNN
jgi:hypothetical protein